MALKFLSSDGSGTLDNAIDAIEYAIRQKRAGVNLRVISNSWGGDEDSAALNDAVKAANDEGMLFVAAAGNAAGDNDAVPTYPANIDQPNVIAVAAVDRNGNLADFSNFGATTVQLAAPGVDIVSTWLNNTYKTLSGTSMAAPHVAGVATLLINKEPNLTVAELKSRLIQTTKPLDSLHGLTLSAGLVNASNALSNKITPLPPPEKLPGYNQSQGTSSDTSNIGSSILNVDDGFVEINLPFSFPFFQEQYSRLAVSSNGRVIPLKPADSIPTTSDFSNRPLPGISVYQDDYVPGASGGVFLQSNSNSITLTWVVAPFAYRNSSDSTAQEKFQLQINSSGILRLNFIDTNVGTETYDSGASATVGVAPILGTKGERLVISNNAASSLLQSGKSITLTPKKLSARSDIDGDDISDPVFFNQRTGGFRALLSSGNYSTPISVKLGQHKDQPFVCDIDGDKRADFLVYRASEQKWYYQVSGRNYSKLRTIPWGDKDSTPMVGDFDGDGKCDLVSVDVKAKQAKILLSSGGFNWKGAINRVKGTTAVIKRITKLQEMLVGDFNGDGKESLSIITRNVSAASKKLPPATVLSCDLNSDGRSESISVSQTSFGALVWDGGSIADPIQYGQTGDRASCSNDYDGDGAGDITVFRPSTMELFIRKSSDGSEFTISPQRDEKLVS